MLKITLTLLAVLISIYWAGEKARKNPKIDAFLSAIEGYYSSLNGQLEETTITNGLCFLRKLYGWVSISLFTCLCALQWLFQPSQMILLPLLTWICGLIFISWLSIKWVIDHKKTINEFSKNNTLIILGPLIMGACDLVFHTSFTDMLLMPFQQVPLPLHLNMPEISNPLAIGCSISLFLLVLLGLYYLLTWAIMLPVFMISLFAVIAPIKFAQTLAKIDRNNTFFWLTVFLMFVISIWLTQL